MSHERDREKDPMERFEVRLEAIEQRIVKEQTDTFEAIELLIEQTEITMTKEIEDRVDWLLDTHLTPANDHLVELVTSTDSETIMDKVDALGEKVDALSKKVDDHQNKLSQ